MAFISHNGVLCRDLWPRKAASLPNDYESAPTLPKWGILPDAYEELCERIFVEGTVSTTAKVFAVHPELNGHMQFAVRLQGIVSNVQLDARGDWNGDVEHAVKAMQSLTLANEGCQAAFVQQRNALTNLEEFILTRLRQGGSGFRSRVVQKGGICLRRWAFTKAGDGVKKVSLSKAEDDNGSISKMSHMWVVDHIVKASILHPSGVVTKVHPFAIRRGDLVDVAATVEVVNMRGRGGRRSEVMISPNHIVRLKSAIQLRAEAAQTNQTSNFSEDVEPGSSQPELPVDFGLGVLDNIEEEEMQD